MSKQPRRVLKDIRSFGRQAWFAVRYGDWNAGWDSSWGRKPDEPFFYCKPFYYDGHHCYVRIGKFWFGVTY